AAVGERDGWLDALNWMLKKSKEVDHPECDKLGWRLIEWNAIFPFIEWLQENRMCIGVWRDPEAPYENLHTGETGTIKEMAEHLLEHPYPSTVLTATWS
ncbi:unnamed protein product, partial [marine sediment metagenome]